MILYEKNFKLTGNNQDPTLLPYNIVGLWKKITINDAGELVLEEYFNAYDSATDTYSDLVVSEARAFTRSPTNGWIISRESTITWYFEDNTVGCTKVTNKNYTPEQAYSEGKRRRTNITNRATLVVLSAVPIADAVAFLDSAQMDINIFISGNTAPLIANVTASTLPAPTIATILYLLGLA